MTPEEIAEIKARVDKATPAPWTAGGDYAHPAEICIAAHLPFVELEQTTQGGNDAAFIAHARTDVPALLAEVERLTESVSWLEAQGVVFALDRDDAKAEVERLTDALTAVDQDAAEARMERDEAKAQVEQLLAATDRADSQGVYVLTTASIRAHLQAADGGEQP